jgi:chromosome segregation ATPase
MALDHEQHEREQRREQIEQQAAERETTVRERAEELEQQQAELERERTRLAELQSDLQSQQEALGQRAEQIETDRGAHEERLAQVQAECDRLRQELTTSSAQIDELRGAIDERQTALETAESTVEQLTQRIEQLEAELTAARREAEAANEELAAERSRVKKEHEDTRSALVDAEAQRDAAQRERDALRERLESAQSTNGETERQVTGLRAMIAELERAIASRDETIEQLRTEIDAADTGIDPETHQQQVNELERRIEQLQAEARRAEQAATDAQKALEAERARLVDTGPDAEQQEQLQQMQAELARLEDEKKLAQQLREEAESSRDEQCAALQERIDALQQQLESDDATDTTNEVLAALEQERDALQQRIEELESRLAEAKSGGGEDESQMLQQLRAKARQLSDVADHLRRRHARLRRMRVLLRERQASGRGGRAKLSHADIERQAAQMRHLEQQRMELNALKKMLAVAERKMIRRWARPRAVIVVGWLVIIAVIAAAGSWVATNHYFPAVISASATLEAERDGKDELTTEEARAWQEWHTDLITDQEFLKTLAKRMRERRIEAYGDPQVIQNRLVSDLTIDAAEPGELTLTLAGTHPERLTAFLDVLVSTVELESSRQIRSRPGTVRAEVQEQIGDDGQFHASLVNPAPIKDERLGLAAPIFGAAFFALLLLVAVVYLRLTRVKREFDDDGTLFDEHAGVQSATELA